MAEKYIMRVTAGPDYDLKTHVEVPVNSTAAPLKISSPHMDAEVAVRIQGYSGLPRKSPSTSPYFSTPPHADNGDRYSIALRFTPKTPSSGGKNEGISGADLQWGNDFDHPIRSRLPPGFNTALRIVRWWIDPGLDGDAYADKPYLYGPALSSFNVVRSGAGEIDTQKGGLWVEEGGDKEREATGAPEDAKARMKWALGDEAKTAWTWQYGKTYAFDFFNPYLDFTDLALRLPGFTLPIMKYWDGQGLRYVLRNRSTGQVYLVVLFTLYLKEDVNEDGTLKPGALESVAKATGGPAPAHDDADKPHDEHEPFDEQKALEEAKRHLSPGTEDKSFNFNDDDVD